MSNNSATTIKIHTKSRCVENVSTLSFQVSENCVIFLRISDISKNGIKSVKKEHLNESFRCA